MDNYLHAQQAGSSHPVGNYMLTGRPGGQQAPQDPHKGHWEAMEHHVNQLDLHAKALGIPTHDLLKKLIHPDYAGPQGLNWEKMRSDHQRDMLANAK